MPQDLKNALNARLSSNVPIYYVHKLRERRPWIRYWIRRAVLVRQFKAFANELGIAPQSITVPYLSLGTLYRTKAGHGWVIHIETRSHPLSDDRKVDVVRGELMVTSNGTLRWVGNYHLWTPRLEWIEFKMLDYLHGVINKRGNASKASPPDQHEPALT